jgi:hypothetical protein
MQVQPAAVRLPPHRRGRELVPALRVWGGKWAVGAPPLRVEHQGHPVRTRVICATCGERVRDDDLGYLSTVPR